MTLFESIKSYYAHILYTVHKLKKEHKQLLEQGYISDAEPYENDDNIILYHQTKSLIEGIIIAQEGNVRNLREIINKFENEEEPLKELFSDADPERTLHELQDLVQSYVTLMMVQAKPTSLDERDTEERVIQLLEQSNQDHRKKMERYRADGRLK